ncbi:MAG: glycosyltransferase [Chloroflexi bacterium]|nr:glycosyltransferase [Chloroflexota bacterium]
MFDLWLVPIALIYLVVVGMLFAYGVNFFYLTFIAWRARDFQPTIPALGDLPRVTVQLPIFNELYVAERLINAVAQFDYPNDLLEIQVLDDSTDETVAIIQHAVERARARGVNIAPIQRAARAGFKAGALANGLAHARGEFIAIFDADFIPPRDFLRRTLPHFHDARVAFVQTRWGHTNREYSLLTLLQALSIDAHFVVEQFARSRGNYWFNFNGTAGVWRRAALDDAGGWQTDTLTEDLDLSYRAFLRGWRAIYLRDVVVPAELPVSFSAYRRQQHRWARGSFECALKLLPHVWCARIPRAQKIEATFHLTGYGVHLLLFALALLYPVVLALTLEYPQLISLFGLAVIFNATAFAPTLFFMMAQHQLERKWWQTLPAIFLLTITGAGMMLNTGRAAFEIFLQRAHAFERTPKFGITRRGQTWQRRRYQLRLDSIIVVEIFFAFVNLGTAFFALTLGNWLIALYATLYAAGLFFTAATTLAQIIPNLWQNAAIAPATTARQ